MNLNPKISTHAKDTIQKYTSALFKDKTLAFYGIQTAPIKEIINVELPIVEVAESSTDFVFLLEDETYLHLEFQTTYNKNDLIRFAVYDLRLFERDKRMIRTVVIYSADVKNPSTELNIGSLVYKPDTVTMNAYDGHSIYMDLRNKVNIGNALSDVDILNLIFLPLMNTPIERGELAVQSIKLAQTIPDQTKRTTCIAAVFAFANRYLKDSELSELVEVLRMTDLLSILVEERAMEIAVEKAEEIAKKALRKGSSIEFISEITDLDEATIKQLQAELNNE